MAGMSNYLSSGSHKVR